MISFILVNSIFGYKLFEFLLWHLGYMKDEWVDNPYENEFFEYKSGLFQLRIIYFIILLILVIPLILQKDLESLKWLN